MSEAPTLGNDLTATRYFALADEGVLGPDDRTELLEGMVVSVAPQYPRHASAVARLDDAIRRAVGERACVRIQLPIVVSERSVPEPDLALVAGRLADYDAAHPRTALLVVEVADRSLAQDRLTKLRIYAAAAIPEYWIVNLRDERVEVLRDPVPAERRYASREIARRGGRLAIAAIAGAALLVDDLLPAP